MEGRIKRTNESVEGLSEWQSKRKDDLYLVMVSRLSGKGSLHRERG